VSRAAPRWSVRRFVAVDLFGANGRRRRRRLVFTEFIVGTAALLGLGAVLVVRGGYVPGIWALGCGVNYLALAVYATRLLPSGRLGAELTGIDTTAELRRYSAAQVTLFIPLLVLAIAVTEATRRSLGACVRRR
jgi:hypothetical protein